MGVAEENNDAILALSQCPRGYLRSPTLAQ